LEYPELVQYNIAVKLKSWIYNCCHKTATSGHDDVTTLVKNICNAVDHWAGVLGIITFVLKLILPKSVYNIQM
jgi:hypothetical protein